jgi:chromosome partitioning protein
LLLGKDLAMDALTALAPDVEPLDEVISVLHTKGGAGKSSLTTNVAFELARLGYKVLVIDLDRQTGQSVGFGLGSVTFTNRGPGSDIGAVLRGDLPLAEAIIEDIYPGLDLLPAEEHSLMQAEHVLAELGPEGTVRLFEILHESPKRWDVVFIDTPGRKTDILEVALAASTGVLVPAIPEGGPVSELSSVLRHVAKAKDLYGSVEVYGIVRMRVGGNSRYRRLAEEQTKEVAAAFGVPVLKNKVPEDAKFGEAHLAREPIGAYAESARSAIAYKFIAAELVALRGWPSRTGDRHQGAQSNIPVLAPLGDSGSPLGATAALPEESLAASTSAAPIKVVPDAPAMSGASVPSVAPTSTGAGTSHPESSAAAGAKNPQTAQTVETTVPPSAVSPPNVPVTAAIANTGEPRNPVLAEMAPLDTDQEASTVAATPAPPTVSRPPARPTPRHARKSVA